MITIVYFKDFYFCFQASLHENLEHVQCSWRKLNKKSCKIKILKRMVPYLLFQSQLPFTNKITSQLQFSNQNFLFSEQFGRKVCRKSFSPSFNEHTSCFCGKRFGQKLCNLLLDVMRLRTFQLRICSSWESLWGKGKWN